MVVLDHGNNVYSLVAGLGTIHVRVDQRVTMGMRLGLASPPERRRQRLSRVPGRREAARPTAVAAVERGVVVTMKHTRTVFLSVSIGVVLLFSGVLMANRNNQDVLFRALGQSGRGGAPGRDRVRGRAQPGSACRCRSTRGSWSPSTVRRQYCRATGSNEYLEFVGSPPAFGLGLATRLGSASVYFVLQGSPAETAGLDRWEVIELVEGVNSRGRPLWQIRLDLMERERSRGSRAPDGLRSRGRRAARDCSRTGPVDGATRDRRGA